MARYPWFPLWIDDLMSSSNFSGLKFSTQGVYLNVLRYVRREPGLLGLVVHASGKAITIRELASLIHETHPGRVVEHLEKLFEGGLLEMDGERIRVAKFQEKLAQALTKTLRTGATMEPKRLHNGAKTEEDCVGGKGLTATTELDKSKKDMGFSDRRSPNSLTNPQHQKNRVIVGGPQPKEDS